MEVEETDVDPTSSTRSEQLVMQASENVIHFVPKNLCIKYLEEAISFIDRETNKILNTRGRLGFDEMNMMPLPPPLPQYPMPMYGGYYPPNPFYHQPYAPYNDYDYRSGTSLPSSGERFGKSFRYDTRRGAKMGYSCISAANSDDESQRAGRKANGRVQTSDSESSDSEYAKPLKPHNKPSSQKYNKSSKRPEAVKSESKKYPQPSTSKQKNKKDISKKSKGARENSTQETHQADTSWSTINSSESEDQENTLPADSKKSSSVKPDFVCLKDWGVKLINDNIVLTGQLMDRKGVKVVDPKHVSSPVQARPGPLNVRCKTQTYQLIGEFSRAGIPQSLAQTYFKNKNKSFPALWNKFRESWADQKKRKGSNQKTGNEGLELTSPGSRAPTSSTTLQRNKNNTPSKVTGSKNAGGSTSKKKVAPASESKKKIPAASGSKKKEAPPSGSKKKVAAACESKNKNNAANKVSSSTVDVEYLGSQNEKHLQSNPLEESEDDEDLNLLQAELGTESASTSAVEVASEEEATSSQLSQRNRIAKRMASTKNSKKTTSSQDQEVNQELSGLLNVLTSNCKLTPTTVKSKLRPDPNLIIEEETSEFSD